MGNCLVAARGAEDSFSVRFICIMSIGVGAAFMFGGGEGNRLGKGAPWPFYIAMMLPSGELAVN